MRRPVKRAKQERDQALSKAELVAEVRRLRERLAGEVELKQVVHDLEVHQQELRAQQEQLVQAGHALEESRNRYAELFDFAPVGYLTLDLQGTIEEANDAAGRLLGEDRDHLIGKSFRVFVIEADRPMLSTHLSRCRQVRSPVKIEMELQRRSGETVPVELWTKLSTDSASRSPFLHSAIFDLTERRRAEEERSAAREERLRILAEERAVRAASEAKDRFLAMLSHELRTPLTPILFALSTLETRGLVGEQGRSTLDLIRRSVKMEARLIDDLLDVTRIARDKLRLQLEVTDLHAVLQDAVGVCADEARDGRVEVISELAARAHHVRADPDRLRQVFWNLLKNAIRFTPPGGTVRVRSVDDSPGRVKAIVSDTGIGIERETLAGLFMPFQQGPEERSGSRGLGLGLAISKGLVEAHEGTISAQSAGRGQGAMFEVCLPVVAAAAVLSSISSSPSSPPTNGLRLLVVEDDPDSGVALEETLRARGHTVRRASTVGEAVSVGTGEYDVLITDIQLPDGTGLEIMERLCVSRAGVPGIAISGYGTDDDVRRSLDAGFRCHFTKPFDVLELLQAIDAAVAPPSPTA